MHPKIKVRPAGQTAPARIVKPSLPHDVTNLGASAKSASRKKAVPQPGPGVANHARHHVAVKSQS